MQRPNIVLILIDDMGWRDLSCYGSPYYETPVLDQLAAEGMRFTQAYAAAPVCSPTRASLLTGKYPARLGITNYIYKEIDGREGAVGRLIDAPFVRELSLAETAIARPLRDAGYATWHVGKWHLGDEPFWPLAHGFKVNIAGCEMGHPWNGYFSPYNIPTLHNGAEGEYLTDRLTNEAIQLVRDHHARHTEQPFFLNLWHYTLHTPIQAPEPLVEKYRKKSAELGLDRIPPFELGDYFPLEHKKEQRIQRRKLQSDPVYAAMVENLDTNIGRLLVVLEEIGQKENTVILFTSDNGGLATAEGSPTCNAPLNEGKGWMYEGGTREPFIACWHGVTSPGSTCDVPITTPDFYPTLLEIAGLTPMPEQHRDGVSFVPLLRGEVPDRLRYRPIFWHYPHYGNQGGTPGAAVRQGDWKYIEFYEEGRGELYHLPSDISEQENRIAAEPEEARRLQALLHEWQKSVAAVAPKRNPDWKPPLKATDQ